MFKAAKPAPLAGNLDNHAQATKAPDAGPLSKPTESMQDKSVPAAATTLTLAEADLSCGKVMSGTPAERDLSSVAGLGIRHNDQTGSAQAHKGGDPDRSEEVMQQAAVGVSTGQQQGRSSDAACEGSALHSIDLAEQKQILHELWLEKNALSARASAKRPAVASKADSKRTKLLSGNSRQTQIFSMLRKPP